MKADIQQFSELRMSSESSRQEFIVTVAPIAVRVRVDGGPLLPSVSIAQTILETGGAIPEWCNIVGYKVGSGQETTYWHGRSVNRHTWEVYDGQRDDDVYADFRAYDSVEDCLKDQALLFLNWPENYQPVIDAETPEEQARALYDCHYATDAPAEVDGDPAYYEKIMAIIRSYGLTVYDEEAEQGMEAIRELQDQVQTLQKSNQKLKADLAGARKELAELKAQQSMDAPEWAKEAVDAAVNAKPPLIDTPSGGSYDFYRLLAILKRKEVI
jgi:flagellar protein FlgJ